MGGFRGRSAELAGLRSGGRSVLLYGLSGVGKTELVTELLRSPEFQEAPAVTIVGDCGPNEIMRALARGLSTVPGLSDAQRHGPLMVLAEPGATWDAGIRAMRLIVERIPVVLVLDGFEENLRLDGAEWTVTDTTLAKFIASWTALDGRQRLIVTSRHTFTLAGQAEMPLELRPLSGLPMDDARDLMPLLDREQQERAWNLLDGNPNSLKYLDGLLRVGNLTFEEVADRLATPDPAAALLHELLDAFGGVAGDLMLGMAVFRGRLDDRAAAWNLIREHDAAAAPELVLPEGMETALDQLERVGLIQRYRDPSGSGERMWTMPRSTASLLRDPELADGRSLGLAHQAAMRYWSWRAESVFGNDAKLRPLLEVLHHWHIGGGLTGTFYLEEAVRVLLGWGATDPAEHLLEEYLTRLGDEGQAFMLGCLWLGVVHQTREEWEAAKEWLERAVAAADKDSVGDRIPLARALHHLGWVACERGDLERAVDCYHKSVELAQEEGVGHLVADNVLLLARIRCRRGEAVPSVEAVNHAYGTYQRIMRAPDATFQFRVGRIAEDLRDPEHARKKYEEAAADYAREGNARQAAFSLLRAARMAAQVHDGAAITLLEEATRRFERVDDLGGRAEALEELAALAGTVSEFAEAEDFLKAALTLRRENGDEAGTAEVQLRRAVIATRQGDHQRAEELCGEARRVYQRAGRVADDVIACLTIGEAAQTRQDVPRAEDWYQRGLDRAREAGFWLGATIAHTRLGELAESVADMQAAAGQHALAVTVAIEHEVPTTERSLKALIKLRRQISEEELRRYLTAAIGPATADVLNRMTNEMSDPQP